MNRNDAYQKWVDGNINVRYGSLQREAFYEGWNAKDGKDKDAMRLALETLEYHFDSNNESYVLVDEAIAALSNALGIEKD